jgi:type IV pilus assembly protein PilB
MAIQKKPLGEYMIEENLITRPQLEKALALQAKQLQGGTMPLIGTVLIQIGAVKEQDVTFALERQERDRMRV